MARNGNVDYIATHEQYPHSIASPTPQGHSLPVPPPPVVNATGAGAGTLDVMGSVGSDGGSSLGEWSVDRSAAAAAGIDDYQHQQQQHQQHQQQQYPRGSDTQPRAVDSVSAAGSGAQARSLALSVGDGSTVAGGTIRSTSRRAAAPVADAAAIEYLPAWDRNGGGTDTAVGANNAAAIAALNDTARLERRISEERAMWDRSVQAAENKNIVVVHLHSHTAFTLGPQRAHVAHAGAGNPAQSRRVTLKSRLEPAATGSKAATASCR